MSATASHARRDALRRGLYRLRQSSLSMVGLALVVLLLVLAGEIGRAHV